MPKLLRLEESKHVRGRVLVFFEGAELVRLTANEVLEHRLYAGKELSPEEYEALVDQSRLTSAKHRAAVLISRTLVSRAELIARLIQKGERPQDCEAAAAWLEELGLLDDTKTAATVARHYAARGYGRKKIESELFRRKIPRELWADALSELGDGSEVLERLVERKLRGKVPDEKELGRLQGYLLRRGFDWQQVKEALENVSLECEM